MNQPYIINRTVVFTTMVLFFVTGLYACGPRETTEKDDAIVDAAATVVEELVATPVEKKRISQDEAFEKFKEQFLTRYWQLYPSSAVYSGYYLHDDQLEIPNGDLRAQRRSFFVRELQALKQFDATQMSLNNASDISIIDSSLRAEIWYIDRFRRYEWDPAVYNVAGTFGVILNTEYKPLAERLATILVRLDNVPAYYAAAQGNIKTPTLEHLSLAIQQTKGVLGMFESSIPNKLTDADLTKEQVDAFTPKLEAAVDAIKGYLAWMQETQVELSKDANQLPEDELVITPRSFRIGAEKYEKKFAHDIVSNYTAEELYQLALNAKDTLHQEMAAITNELWPKYFQEQAMPEDELVAVKTLIDHLSKRHVERDKFVDEIRRQMPIIQKFMDDNELLDSDPTRPLVVRLTPEYQRGFAGASVNAPGPYDATANTYYNVSPLDDYTDEQAESYLREYNHWILQILNIHEATPGHYTQLMHANKSPSKIKSVFANGAMIEGWAVYSERMMLEAGYGDNEPEMWLMYSKWNLRIVVNTILDYSVHVLDMTREQAIDMLMNEAFQERTEAEGKWRRATISQVQLTSYFTGYSEIYAFREELKEKMGESFDLKTFHNKFLSYGNAPVPLIRNLMLKELGL